MGYANISDFRKLTNISKELISDPILQGIFKISDRILNKLATTRIGMEKLFGDVDGSNTFFYTKHRPIADFTTSNTTTFDACEVTTDWAASTDATAVATTSALSQGAYSLKLGKSGTASVDFSYSKTKSATVDCTGMYLQITILVKNTTELAQYVALTVRLGNDSSNYYEKTFDREELVNGKNEISILITDMGSVGTPAIATLDYMFIGFKTSAAANTVTSGNVAMDYWRVSDIDSPDTADVNVYLSYEDSENQPYFNGPVAVSAIRSKEGRITLTTAPTNNDNTSTGAECGVYADYSYCSATMDWDLINAASCYLAAHLSSFIIAGSTPNYGSIEEAILRRDLAGAPDEWLRLAYTLISQAVGDSPTGVGFRRIQLNNPMEG